ncbi:MAG: transposase [Saprospiraceae bacterium]|nr:transposase [Saprospiraceae bacterium]
MHFVPNRVYHIFNQGNNKELLFFSDNNYYFFLEKIKKHIYPHCQILAYCLMPNHFHLLVYTTEASCLLSNGRKPRRTFPTEEADQRDYQVILSHQIGVCLRSYTRAINIQEGRTGSLFRKGTKAKHFLSDKTMTLEGIQLSAELKQLECTYLKTVFDYIHNNPVKADLTNSIYQWPFSSAVEYAGEQSLELCDIELARELMLSSSLK